MITEQWTDSETGDEYHVHHNGDWSGEAIINVPTSALAGSDVLPLQPASRQPRTQIILPGKLLKFIGRNATIRDGIEALENLLVEE